MTGRPQPRRSTAGRNVLPSGHSRILLTSLLAVFVLVFAAGFGLLAAGCGSADVTTTTAAPATTAPADTTTSAPAETTTSAAPAETTTSLAEGTFPVTVTDDAGTQAAIKAKPVRIVSTAPAGTEILFAIGAGDRVVGVSALDDYPAEVADIAKVGDFQLNTEAIMGLSPDLVLAYSGFGSEDALAPVKAAGAPVLLFNAASLDAIYGDITIVGAATGNVGQAAALVDSMKAEIQKIKDAAAAAGSAPKVFYAVDNTLWTVGPGSFVDELLKDVNVVNVGNMPGSSSAAAQQYYQFSAEQLVAADPDIILLPNTAYKSIDEFTKDPRFASLTAVTNGKVILVNDTLITRPGPRIALGLKDLLDAVHPGALK